MNKLIVLSGVPGSGKSYFSKTLKKVKNNHVYIVSSDGLRETIGGAQSNLTNEELMWKIFYALAKAYAQDKDGIVVLDATHVTTELRVDRNQQLKPLFDQTYLLMWDIDKQIVSNQNLQREYPIPPEALEMFFNIFEKPNEKDREFFDKIIMIENSDIAQAIKEVIDDGTNDNPLGLAL
ncbi:MAG: AAA family ATPase [Bacilli bacterium]|nr:AAA family ATPase [Bacilli bacterium]